MLFNNINIKKLSAWVLSGILIAGAISPAISTDADAKRAKARTSQTSKKKKKSRSSKRNRGSRGGAKRKAPRRTSAKVAAPPQETPSYDSLTLAVNRAVIDAIPANVNPGGLRVNNVRRDTGRKIATVSLNDNFTYLPVTKEFIEHLQKSASTGLPDSLRDYRIALTVGSRPLAYYITKVDKLPEKYRKNTPFVVARDPYVHPKKGMEGDIVALWSSHGRYYKPGSGAWMWQRPLLFETVEDTYTMGYILPFVVPMLENAGAYVMLPRERDTNSSEVIVDNDTNEGGEIYSQPYYKEMNGARKWQTGEGEGFIYDLADFRDTENPFENGTYRQVETVKGGSPSAAAWYADIPADGEYAVYVSYKSLPNSTSDARYTVNYSGGAREFTVNQKMGGGTWIYLGTFPLEAGYSDTEPVVTLSNLTEGEPGTVVTADAVKIGGGMGNIARSRSRRDIYYDPSTPDAFVPQQTSGDAADDDDDNAEDEADDESVDGEAAPASETDSQPAAPASKGPAPVFRTSGMPRFLEGARYWLHWAGAPEHVYSPYHGGDDYKDDYTARGHWVNWLAGGSRVLPGKQGLNIPVDVTMALHSDAGKRSDDSFVGTLGIYFTANGDSYKDGTPRINSRMLTDMLMRQITSDIRATYEPRWTRRSMWDKSYVEARVPEVPTALIELMSHQNFADMQYGLDPSFRFTVGRAIYKALARFVAERKDREVVIQPLPVRDFAIHRSKKGHYRLEWQPTPDPLEQTAMPDKYIIFERREGELGFHKIGETSSTHYDVRCADSEIHSFKVVAANQGGVSFPSEILAFREGEGEKHPVLIVNGFTRVSGPDHFSENGNAGFRSEVDFGVPYIKDISFTGHQTEFRRGAGESFGRSAGNYATKVIAGNTFDYASVHGKAVADAGMGFVSASVGAVERGDVKLSDYKIVDLILGKQKTTVVGNGKSGVNHRTFPAKLQQQIEPFLSRGGKLVASGQFVASDLLGPRATESDSIFAADVLGILPAASSRTHSGRVSTSGDGAANGMPAISYFYSNTLNENNYIVDSPDALQAAPDADATILLEYSDTEAPAAVLTRHGRGRSVLSSIPIEAVPDERQRAAMMRAFLKL